MAHGIRLTLPRLIAAQSALLALSWRNLQQIPALPLEMAVEGDKVTLIVPVRNEAERLPDLLESLKRLRYRDVDILIVDDGSDDGSADLVRDFGFQVLDAGAPASGWTGKCHACWQGAQQASGTWLLFTDADTIHRPESLGRAMTEAKQVDAGLLSLLPQHRCESFWERLLMPYAYAAYFAGAIRVNKRFGVPMANGQYLLFDRETYFQIGGHAAVRESVVEDAAFARIMKRECRPISVYRAENALEIRMYTGFRSLWEGYTKNAVRLVRLAPVYGSLTAVLTALNASAFFRLVQVRNVRHGLVLLGIPAIVLSRWYRLFGTPRAYAALYPLAAIVFHAITFESARRTFSPRGTRWRGRRY